MAAMTVTQEDEEKKKQEQAQHNVQTVQSIMGSNSYTPGSSVTQAQEQLKAYQDKKPEAYTNRWKDQMDSILNDILNRKDFSYDVKADPLFQQYRDQYVRNGQLAMRDTMGQAAQLTGGYGNSYAQQAGQQAYNGYMQGLTDKIPELYSLAMQAYNNKNNDMMNRYNLMGTQEGKEYSRYQDGMNAYNAELERLQNLYNTERSYDYGQYRDSITDAQQQWANAWAMFRAGKDTPEIREILGLPAKGSSSSKSSGGGDDGGGSSTKKKSNYNLSTEAAKIASQYGGLAAYQYINEQTGGKVTQESANAKLAALKAAKGKK